MIKLVNVSKEYIIDSEYTFYALKKASLEIKEKEFVSIMGPSGSGKSTLMHIVGLLDKPTTGKVYVDNKEISRISDDDLSKLRNEFVGFVFQQFNLINKLTVLENVMLPSIYCRKELDFDPNDRAESILNDFGLSEKRNSYPNKLSGGQQQRVAITRALMMKPKLILADEPTGNLDSKTGHEIMMLLEKLNKEEKITVVLVTHEKDIAAYAKRIINIKDGEII
ncbi:lipoprotein-releasing system ATP-binding protein LolD [Candidatus Roizmanbacteria bacterium CG_4_8_14_3_um_filter_36_10]|uniref:Lipoprotein-releasing system ATP-binding protein LolD n=2 Tax=Candidatus Roizmaniibacteriota TaxID=1752723 RepID=A0A2M7BXL3_9BACT|nr:ABC transporter ATP-binding protein [Candidatus Roizmanbacteria bacterium]PIV11313.1 MAG: lipoprotein-releasing system ATP-binding protein LolD [Candidatus Roizmanbacteria bacterium CG03_land_8_20_14_0_80_35_26]PJC81496.1 MAG: lipoprotein-releasing system ATP-binding protein LolD [Candidatus Roizmanbacteria bacterium CG_4_8_14_3_um_filter_36_10]